MPEQFENFCGVCIDRYECPSPPIYLHNYGMRNVAAGSVDWLLLKEVRGRNVRTAGGLTWSITEVNSKKTT